YNISNYSNKLESYFYNIAYFGVFYANRNLDQFIEVLYEVSKKYSMRVKLHIYTNDTDKLKDILDTKYLDIIKLNNYISYLDFLKVSKDFDCLLVNDAEVSEIFGINPYLPSKISDYIGANVPIFALVEKSSALSNLKNITYKVELGDVSNM